MPPGIPARETTPEVERSRRPSVDAGCRLLADELNDRPRKRLGFAKPTEQIADLLAS